MANGHTTVYNARLQAVYDLAASRFLHFSLDSCSRNDLAAAPDLPLEAGDLVLRDRGYLTCEEIERHLQAGAHCIRGHNPSKEVLALMDWTIFLTTIGAQEADFQTILILAIYGLRWRIEIIFKSWKSHLNFAALHRVSQTQLRILIAARLLVITALSGTLYRLCHQRLWKRCQRHLSLLKFLHYLARNPGRIAPLCTMILCDLPGEQCLRSLLKYCCYDKRKHPNFQEIFEHLLLT